MFFLQERIVPTVFTLLSKDYHDYHLLHCVTEILRKKICLNQIAEINFSLKSRNFLATYAFCFDFEISRATFQDD